MKVKLSTPFLDQKPGTSGLRKKVSVFQQAHYTESFIQATLNAVFPKEATSEKSKDVKDGVTLVVGGDGRFFSKEAIQIIIKICSANRTVSRLIIGQNGILSTPAVSNLIRKRGAFGGLILTASHNPGGQDGDFGIKYNASNGGPATETLTDLISKNARELDCYWISEFANVPLDKLGEFKVGGDEVGAMIVEIVDCVDAYVSLMKTIFDFDMIKKFFASTPSFSLLFDGMHGVTGPYAKRLFVTELGLPATCCMNATPLPDFGGGHPDPNLTYASALVQKVNAENISFGAASDGDGDRNMIIGCDGAFVNPSDSVAVIADNWEAVPYFKRDGGLKGVARSMPTSCALDRVAKKLGVGCYEVPTGWKFFGNLMDASKLSVCGEESFGTGSDHIREKDGIWAILAWLQILAYKTLKNKDAPVSLRSVLSEHFVKYGRNFFTRYDFEDVDSKGANEMMAHLTKLITTDKTSFVGKKFGTFVVKDCDNFQYTDPIDHSVSSNQGIRIIFEDTSRIIFRLSGTGSSGATVRLYVEQYTDKPEQYEMEPQVVLKPLVDLALTVSKLSEFTGRREPTVIT